MRLSEVKAKLVGIWLALVALLTEAYETGAKALKLDRFKADTWGIEQNIIQVVIVLAVLMLATLILAPLQNQAETQITKLNDTQVSNTWSDIKEATWGSMSMFTIVPYVVIFVVIIGLILLIARR